MNKEAIRELHPAQALKTQTPKQLSKINEELAKLADAAKGMTL